MLLLLALFPLASGARVFKSTHALTLSTSPISSVVSVVLTSGFPDGCRDATLMLNSALLVIV